MYPLLRFAKETIKFRNAPPLAITEVHVSTHICWPWDLDPWIELNNGRTLTLFDLGRIPMAQRSGLIPVLRDRKWGITVAGDSPQFSALTARNAPPQAVGSVLTLTNSIGFAISIVSILLFVELTRSVPLHWLLTGLAIGPALGLWALRPLWRGEGPA